MHGPINVKVEYSVKKSKNSNDVFISFAHATEPKLTVLLHLERH